MSGQHPLPCSGHSRGNGVPGTGAGSVAHREAGGGCVRAAPTARHERLGGHVSLGSSLRTMRCKHLRKLDGLRSFCCFQFASTKARRGMCGAPPARPSSQVAGLITYRWILSRSVTFQRLSKSICLQVSGVQQGALARRLCGRTFSNQWGQYSGAGACCALEAAGLPAGTAASLCARHLPSSPRQRWMPSALPTGGCCCLVLSRFGTFLRVDLHAHTHTASMRICVSVAASWKCLFRSRAHSAPGRLSDH